MKFKVIRTSGIEEEITCPQETVFSAIEKAIGTTSLDHVNLHNGKVMWVDDLGYETETIEHRPGVFELRCTKARKPVNSKATELYHSVCVPGTTHQIVGDVAITSEDDFND